MRTKHLLYFGFITPVIFWLNTLICGYLLKDYSHLTNYVSELGAVGTKTQTLFSIGVALCAVSNTFFLIGLYKACKELGVSVIPAYILVSFSISMFGVALFSYPLIWHAIGNMSIFLNFAPLAVFFLWKRNNDFQHIRVFSLVMFVIMVLHFGVHIPRLNNHYPGLIQRLGHIGWSTWFIYLSFNLNKLLGIKKKAGQASYTIAS